MLDRVGSKHKPNTLHLKNCANKSETLIYVLLFSTDAFVLSMAVIYNYLLYMPSKSMHYLSPDKLLYIDT